MKIWARKIHKRHGASALEYMFFIVIVAIALAVMYKPMARTFFGRWKTLGDSFAHGEQYDPGKTEECSRQVFFQTNPPVEYWVYQPGFEACMMDEAPNDLSACEKCLIKDDCKDICREKTNMETRRNCCANACVNFQICTQGF